MKLMSQTDFMCAMMSIVSSMVRNELSQPFLCILIDVHRKYIDADDAIAFCLYHMNKRRGKTSLQWPPLYKGHFPLSRRWPIVKSFNCICIVPTVNSCKFFLS